MSEEKLEVKFKDSIFDYRDQPIEFSNGQKEALEKVQKFLETKNENFFLLAGYSGTGKTTIAENIVKFANANVLAPTNTAVNRLREKIRGSKADFMTIHRCLFAPPKDDGGEFRKDKSFESGRTYIIDEVSMVDRFTLDTIIKDAILKNCKIIFLGDNFQLEPIGDDPKIFKWEESYPEHFLPHNRYELTEVRRYDGTLLKIATELRTRRKAMFTMPDNSDLSIVSRFTRKLGEDIAKNSSYVILTATNDNRMKYNDMVRQFRYKKEFPMIGDLPKTILKNERLISISNGNFYSNGEIFNAPNLQLIETFQLEYYDPKLNENQKVMFRESEKPKVNKAITFHLYKVTKETGDFGEDDKDEVRIFDKYFNNKSQDLHSHYILFSADIKEPSFHGPTLLKTLTKNSGLRLSTKSVDKYLFVKNEFYNNHYFNKNVTIATYGYAVSTHKSQGNEWDNVYIHAPFLVKTWDHARWFYTAITRAKKSVELHNTSFIRILNETH